MSLTYSLRLISLLCEIDLHIANKDRRLKDAAFGQIFYKFLFSAFYCLENNTKIIDISMKSFRQALRDRLIGKNFVEAKW